MMLSCIRPAGNKMLTHEIIRGHAALTAISSKKNAKDILFVKIFATRGPSYSAGLVLAKSGL
jgi:hypothetical protein